MLNAQLWVSVFIDGAFYGLIALAYYLTLVGSQFFNFAIGPYAMATGLGASWLVVNENWSVWNAVLVMLAAIMVLGAITELAVVRPVQHRSTGGELPALVAVSALLFAVQQVSGQIFGYNPLPGQPIFHTGTLHVGSAVVVPTAVPLLAMTVLVFVLVGAWIRLTRTGRVLRAVGDSNVAARLLGFPVNRIRLIAFILGALIAGLAGLFFAPTSGNGVNFMSGLDWALDGFLALVIGGTGAVWAPLAGGFILAVAQIFVPFYFGGSSVSYVLLALAIVFFAFRPEGIFSRRVRA